MKIKLYSVLLLSISCVSFAQNLKDQQDIISTYDTVKVRNLILSFEFEGRVRQEKIYEYLKKNILVQAEYYSNGKKYSIIDVIEGKPVYITTDNAASALASRTNKLYPGGSLGLSIDGEGMNIGVWDGGHALVNHVEFLNGQSPSATRVTTPDELFGNPSSDFHATHVMGTIGAKGTVSSAKGMAPKANLKSFNWDNDNIEVSSQIASSALLISNHSYGVPIYNNNGEMNVQPWYMGCYNNTAVTWDNLAYTYPYYLMVASAGNSGTDNYTGGLANGYDKLTGNKTAKNNLVVANANPSVHPITGNITSLLINPGSSQGPTDDGRIKPDIAADGTNLYSTYNTNNNSYETLSGTSMSSPTVAGSVLLLQQHFRNLNPNFMKAATLKGLVCHTALDDSNIGPDPRFGWGFLDTSAAAQVITKNSNGQSLIIESVLNQGDTYTLLFNSTSPDVRATICWTDPAGADKSGVLNSPTPVLVNDLDLRISAANNVYFPWKLQLNNLFSPAIKGDNIVDNVERVDVETTSSGQYTLTVSHKGNLTSGSQAFSLILTGTGLSLNNTETEIKNLSIFPNPAENILYYNVDDFINVKTISIIDISGKLFNPVFDINSKTIDVSNLQSGVYFVRFDTADQFIVKKFVKI